MIPLPIRQAGPVESPFNAEQQGRFDAGLQRAIAKYPPERGKAALLAALHLVQDELGWLPEPAMAYVAFRLDVPRAGPRGRHLLHDVPAAPRGPAPHRHLQLRVVLGDGIGEAPGPVCGHARIHPGETTEDGHFSLEEVACLAACGNAPAMLLNNFNLRRERHRGTRSSS